MKPTLGQILKQTRQKPPDLRATNGNLRLHLVVGDQGFSQQILSVGQERPLLEAGWADVALNLSGRELLLPYDSARVLETGRSHARMRAVITRPEFEITSTFELWPDGSIDIATAFAARTNLPLTSIEHRYVFAPAGDNPPWDYLWQPGVKASRSGLVGWRAYRSPCLVIQKGGDAAALIPALQLIERDMPIPPALDFRRPGELRCGLVGQRVTGHAFANRDLRRAVELVPGQSMRFGLRIVAGSGLAERTGMQLAARALWAQYGQKLADEIQPQTLAFDDFARYAYDGIFERRKLWCARATESRRRHSQLRRRPTPAK